MLIIEGPDLVGKTTLCKKLVELLPGHIYSHLTRLPDEFDRYWGYVERMSPGVVQDRFHMSEICYATMRGDLDKSQLDPETYRLVDAKLRLLGAMTVVVFGSNELMHERLWDKELRQGEMYRATQIENVNRIFRDLVQKNGTCPPELTHYEVDCDLWIECTPARPYVTDDLVMGIVYRYLGRRSKHTSLGARRGPLSL